MLQSLKIKLQPSKDDRMRLFETMSRFNEVCNFIADRAFALH